MDENLITLSAAALFMISAALVGLTVVRKLQNARLERRNQQLLTRYRAAVEALVLEDRPLEVEDRPADREAALHVLLRYLRVLKGREAGVLIGYLDEQGYIDRAICSLRSRRRWSRAQAAELLGQLRSRKAVPALIAALSDPFEDVRTVAARSLAAIGDPAAIPALAAALNDPSRWTLSMIAENLMVMGPEAVPPLIEMVRSGDADNVRVAAIQILGEIRDSRALTPIAELLRTADNLNLRAQAAAALGKLGGAAAEEALVSALRDPEWQVRAEAAGALGHVGRPTCAANLADAVNDTSWWVRLNCTEALAALGQVGRRHLERLLDCPDRYVRDQCIAALQIHGHPVAGRRAVTGRRVPGRPSPANQRLP